MRTGGASAAGKQEGGALAGASCWIAFANENTFVISSASLAPSLFYLAAIRVQSKNQLFSAAPGRKMKNN